MMDVWQFVADAALALWSLLPGSDDYTKLAFLIGLAASLAAIVTGFKIIIQNLLGVESKDVEAQITISIREAMVEEKNTLSARHELYKLAENVPRKMMAAKDEDIEIRIGKAGMEAIAQSMLGQVFEHEISGAEIMNVHLSAPQGGFVIEPVGINEPQPTNPSAWGSDQEYASWRWRVTPTKAGSHSLLITVSSYSRSAHCRMHEQQVSIDVDVNMFSLAHNVAVGGGLMVVGGIISAFSGDLYDVIAQLITQRSE